MTRVLVTNNNNDTQFPGLFGDITENTYTVDIDTSGMPAMVADEVLSLTPEAIEILKARKIKNVIFRDKKSGEIFSTLLYQFIESGYEITKNGVKRIVVQKKHVEKVSIPKQGERKDFLDKGNKKL